MPRDRGVEGQIRFAKRVVRENYDRWVIEYSRSSRLQTGNLLNLLNHVGRWGLRLPAGVFLDAGCGIPQARKYLGQYYPEQMRQYVGLDISFNMLRGQSSRLPGLLVNGDLEFLPFLNGRFSVVISNSVLHWLNLPKFRHTPVNACAEICRVLRRGGVFICSVAAVGTGSLFLAAYGEIVRKEAEKGNVRRDLVREDPIGSMSLSEVSSMLHVSGLTVLQAEQHYEPVLYASSDEYAQVVKAYGYEIFMAPFREEVRPRAWTSLMRVFRRRVGTKEYLHDQYMIYAAARKTRI